MEEFLDSIDEANRKCGEIVLTMKKMAVLIRMPNELFREYGIQSMDDNVQPDVVVERKS